VQAAAGLCPGPPVLSGTGFAFRAGSEGVINAASLRLRGRLNRRQFYMPPVGGENLYNRASPDGKQANRPGGDGNAPLFPRSGIGGGAALAAPSRRLVFITVVPNAACTEILRCAQNDEKGGKASEKSFFSGVARWRVRTGKGHFPRAEGAVLLFSRRRRVYILIAAKRRYHNPRPERPSNLRTLRPAAGQT
jgi:hypothetical protein